MPERQPEFLVEENDGVTRAAALLKRGALVALPTETVYGLAADARNDAACAMIFEAKGRPRFNPLIVHLVSISQVSQIAELSPVARDLAQAFWPGALTLVLPLKPGHGLSPLVTAGMDSVAIRLPAHPTARAVLQAFGGPVAAPSANPSGRISPTTAAHVAEGLGDRVAAVLDAGPCAVGVESTILAPSEAGTRLLREGGLPREAIEPLTGPLIVDTTPGRIEAPGQLSRHYAPSVPVTLNSALDDASAVRVGFTKADGGDLYLSHSGDLVEAAAALFHVLHLADAMACAGQKSAIHVAPVPETGLGRAINDRLRRAAAP
ncbi:L-threonylcarbamoyladenylate synthase [Rhodophyticola porphyridii]|uniref:Threonylcarbamoyl-AMP synthase n=1 Tax=Rhodophyticola porphyridii TaxID=1852017 RepID=A0A3L9Y8T9_9RHOB|nr:L-threonylcarbamoyladenylate synthase [Rhodophyticola porphyridii]RMA43708.1 threonylcarbamoyl-AMP synthase [Rhodophyticola porphyridii]